MEIDYDHTISIVPEKIMDRSLVTIMALCQQFYKYTRSKKKFRITAEYDAETTGDRVVFKFYDLNQPASDE